MTKINVFGMYYTRKGKRAYCAEKLGNGVFNFLIEGDNCVTMYYVDESCEPMGILAYPKYPKGKNDREITNSIYE